MFRRSVFPLLAAMTMSLSAHAEEPDFWTTRNSNHAVEVTKSAIDQGAFDTLKGGRQAAKARLEEIAGNIGNSQHGAYNTRLEYMFYEAVDGMPMGASGNGHQIEKLTTAAKAVADSATWESMNTSGSIHDAGMPQSRQIVDRYLGKGHAFESLTEATRLNDTSLGSQYLKKNTALKELIDKTFRSAASGKSDQAFPRTQLERAIMESSEGKAWADALAKLKLSKDGDLLMKAQLLSHMDSAEMGILASKYRLQLSKDLWRQRDLVSVENPSSANKKVIVAEGFRESKSTQALGNQMRELVSRLQKSDPSRLSFDQDRNSHLRYAHDKMLSRLEQAKKIMARRDFDRFLRSPSPPEGGLEASAKTTAPHSRVKGVVRGAKGALPAVVIGAGVAGAALLKGAGAAEAQPIEDAADYQEPAAAEDPSVATLSE